MCSTMFKETLFVIDNTWKQPQLRMDKENVVHLHSGVLLSAKKYNTLNFAGKWMDLEETILNDPDPTRQI